VVIGTDCIGSCTFNYHTTTPRDYIQYDRIMTFKSRLILSLSFSVYCRNPSESPFENGVIYKKGNKSKKFIFQKYIFTIRHGTRLIFVCNHGYIRKGPIGATCVNGTWTPSIDNPGTKCVEQNHPKFPKLWTAEEEKERDKSL